MIDNDKPVYFRPELLPFGREHLKEIVKLPEWMSSLLGNQLTVIGIVFPLVVGLISVLFQKRSSRIHIQSAYQLHSGYMFSGPSGLSLAAFILIGGLVSSYGNKYLNTVFAVTAIIWMLTRTFAAKQGSSEPPLNATLWLNPNQKSCKIV